MSDFKVLTEAPLWYIIVCVLVAAGYATLLYSAKAPWSKAWNWALTGFRFILVLILTLLLLNPFLRMVFNTEDKPIIVVATDNSASIPTILGKETATNEVKKLLEKSKSLPENVEVNYANLDGIQKTKDDSSKTANSSNLQQLFEKINLAYEGRNLAGVVLYSDGIITEGISPENSTYGYPIVTIGTGDTTKKKDIAISSLEYNDIVYAGNKLSLQVAVKQYGYSNLPVTVQVLENGLVLAEQKITLPPVGLTNANLIIAAGRVGLRAFQVKVIPQAGEFSILNNTASAYVEVIDGKERILIAAAAPHPDIKAIRSALEGSDNYEVEVVFPGIGKINTAKPYDLVILHNLPDRSNSFGTELSQVIEKSNAVWYVLGRQLNLQAFNATNGIVQLISTSNNPDKVGGQINADFNNFVFQASEQSKFDKFPPLEAIYGDYKTLVPTEVLLFQKVGNSVTNKPLLFFGTANGKKVGVLAGEGIWNWFIQEYATSQNHEVVNSLIRKTTQYLSSKTDKRKLRVKPTQKEFLAGDKVQFNIESYNDIYERVYNVPVSLAISSNGKSVKKLSFVTSEGNTNFDAGSLLPGVYSYQASATIGKNKETVTGQFLVKELDVELRNLTANHEMLRALAKKTGGGFYQSSQMEQAFQFFNKQVPKAIIRSEESTKELISLAWVFFLLVGIASTEWIIRKLNAGF